MKLTNEQVKDVVLLFQNLIKSERQNFERMLKPEKTRIETLSKKIDTLEPNVINDKIKELDGKIETLKTEFSDYKNIKPAKEKK